MNTDQFHDGVHTADHYVERNRKEYNRALLFGYTEIKFNQHGWLKVPRLSGIEIFEFKISKNFAAHNWVEIGHGRNGKWSFGCSYSFGASGGGFGVCHWGEILDSREDALRAALECLEAKHLDALERSQRDKLGNYNRTICNKILKQIKPMLAELKGAGRQVSIFDFID